MANYDRICENLPSLYRPQTGEQSVLSDFLLKVGHLLDNIADDATQVMQSHWHGYADRALTNSYFNLDRRQQNLEIIHPNTDDAEELLLLNSFPHLNDLARMGSLVSLPPWREPEELKENVEAYRTRLLRFLALYRRGLGTIAALRAIVEANLNPDFSLPLSERDRAFSVEEFAPLTLSNFNVQARGEPGELLGPLMRWDIDNAAMSDAAVTLYIEGLQAEPNRIDATENPMVELFESANNHKPLAIAYAGTLSPGEVLRLQPTYTSVLGSENALLLANSATDPTAGKNWQAMVGAPDNAITQIFQSQDKRMWVAVDSAGDSELWRYDGVDWLRVFESATLGAIHFIGEDGEDLLIGDDTGLHRVGLFPAVKDDYSITGLPEFNGKIVYDVQYIAGAFWIACSEGVFTAEDLSIGSQIAETPLQTVPCYCIFQKEAGIIYVGAELGIFQYHKRNDAWYWYKGEHESDQLRDWEPLIEGEFPTEADVFIPPVYSIAIGADASLWLGTANGIARYYAKKQREYAYKTLLHAYTDIVDSRCYHCCVDARGLLWFCTDKGLFRYDGRDLSQYIPADNRWQNYGNIEKQYSGMNTSSERRSWRFNRNLSEPGWESFDTLLKSWHAFEDDVKASAESPVYTVQWGEAVSADTGIWDNDNFVHQADVPASQLSLRIKVDDQTLVDGGIPVIPALPKGKSTWRYLARETVPYVPTSTPAWSKEGRLVPSPEMDPPFPGRYRDQTPAPAKPALPESRYDEVVFAYNPSAKLRFSWRAKTPFSVVVRLQKRFDTEAIHPAILDRAWQGIQLVRAAGVKVQLAVDEKIVRGELP